MACVREVLYTSCFVAYKLMLSESQTYYKIALVGLTALWNEVCVSADPCSAMEVTQLGLAALPIGG